MGILSDLEPKRVFRFFEELCSIPHGSGNAAQIAAYCENFARSRSLRYVRDGADNVIIFKEGSSGREDLPPVIIQGHLDMVCEKTSDCDIDFSKDGLRLRVNGDFVFAEGTTLGGDDGIAVAYALAILDSDEIEHPPLEVVFTTDEEVGMLGAAKLDYSLLRSRTMLNIDSEEEGSLLVSCAGGVCADCIFPLTREKKRGSLVKLYIGGLLGGHSGTEIDKGRANSNKLMARALSELQRLTPFSLISVNGGLKDNAIPRETFAEILLAANVNNIPAGFAEDFNKHIREEFGKNDPDALFAVKICGETEADVLDSASTERIINALTHLPDGIQSMSADIEGLVQTSLNMGILKTNENDAEICFAARSSVRTEKQELVDKLDSITKELGGTITLEGDYPGWEYKRESTLRELMTGIYERLYEKKPFVQAIHAGLECGMFAEALTGLDCVSFGPNIYDIHTASERLSVSSAKRTWEFLLEVLRQMK